MAKIVFVCSTLERTGPVNIIYNLINSDSFKDNKVAIITLSIEKKDTRLEDFKSLGIPVVCLNLPHSNYSLLQCKTLFSALQKINPDVVHSFGFRADYLCSRELILKTFHVISTLQNYPFDDYVMLYGRFKGMLMAMLHIKALKKLQIVCCCSDFIRMKMIKHKAYNFTTIHNGVDGRQFNFTSRAQKKTLRSKLGFDQNSIIFIFIGYLIPRKNPITIVKAYRKFIEDNPSISSHFIIMGDGPLMDECKTIYNGQLISYIGNQPSTKEWLDMSDVYLSSSYSEGFPTAVMEALASGNICILSDINPHSEMLASMDNKLLFPVEDFKLCAEYMKQLAVSSNLEYLEERSRAYFDNNLSAEFMAQKYNDIYKNIINGIK